MRAVAFMRVRKIRMFYKFRPIFGAHGVGTSVSLMVGQVIDYEPSDVREILGVR